jgi:hypothetical protein
MDGRPPCVCQATADQPIRSIAVALDSTVLTAVGDRLCVNHSPRHLPISPGPRPPFIVPISQTLFLLSESPFRAPAYDLSLKPFDPLTVARPTPIDNLFFYPPDSILYCQDSESLRALTLSKNRFSLAWQQYTSPVRFLCRGRHFLFGARGTEICQRAADGGSLVGCFDSTHGAAILDLKCSDDSLFTAAEDGIVKIWAIAERRVLCELAHSGCSRLCLALHRSSLFVLGSDSRLREYRPGSVAPIQTHDLKGNWFANRLFVVPISENRLLIGGDLMLYEVSMKPTFGERTLPPSRCRRRPRPDKAAAELPACANPLSIARLRTPTVHKWKPPEKPHRLTVAPALSVAPLAPPALPASAPLPAEPIRPKTTATFCKRTFLARMNCFESLPKAGIGISYTNGRVLPSLQNLIEPHLGVLYSVIRDSFVCNLFTAKEQELTNLSPMFARPEHFYDLLSGDSEISQKLLGLSTWVRSRAAASFGEEMPLERFLRVTPRLARADIEAVYLEDRRLVLDDQEDSDRILGDCFPLIRRMEFEGSEARAVETALEQEDCHLKVRGFAVLEKLFM